MSLSDYQKRKVVLRWMIEEYGTKALASFMKVSCGELTTKDLIGECAKCSRAITINNNNIPLKIRLYSHDIERAKYNSKIVDFDITFMSKFFVLSDPNDVIVNLILIKEKRNEWAHCRYNVSYEEFCKYFEEQVEILAKALMEVRNIGCNRLNCVQKPEKIDEIRLALKSLSNHETELKQLVSSRDVKLNMDFNSFPVKYTKTVVQEIMNNYYNKLSNYNPLSFFFGISEHTDIRNIYVSSVLKDKMTKNHLPIDEMYNTIERSQKNIIIEGPAGVGKSTFLRNLLALKNSGQRFQENLLMPFDCRAEVESLEKAISDMFVQATDKYTLSQILEAIKSLNPIFVVDGLDEQNERSRKTIKEIVSWVNNGAARLIATSRAGNELREFLNDFNNANYDFLELTGISGDDIGSMVEKYFNHFCKERDPSTEQKIKTFHRSIFGWGATSPLILVCIIYLLSGRNVDDLNVRNSTQLYDNIFDTLYLKLEKRLRDKNLSISFDNDIFEKNVDNFKKVIYKFAYSRLRNCQTSSFSYEDVFDSMNDKSFNTEALSSILLCQAPFTRAGVARKLSYSFPHKSFQEFLAAKHIIDYKITNNRCIQTSSTIMDIKCCFLCFPNLFHQKSLRRIVGKDLFKNSRLKLFIIGLLVQKRKMTQQFSNELVEKRNYMGIEALPILREGRNSQEIAASLSKMVFVMKIDSDYDLFNSLLEKSCPNLSEVAVHIESPSADAKHTLTLLKSINVCNKNEKVPLSITLSSNLRNKSEEFLRELAGNRCEIDLKGCFTKTALAVLPDLRSLELRMDSSDDVDVVEYLTRRTRGFKEKLFVKTIGI